MTSKISLVNLGKQSAKHNLAIAALLELIYFCSLPLAFLMMLYGVKQQYSSYMGMQETELAVRMAQNATDFLGYNAAGIVLACMCAVLLGIWQFKYLHNAQQMDFYHSFSVKRESFFWVQYLAGFVMWAFIFLINLILAIGIASWNGLMTGELWILTGKMFFIQLISFLMMYGFMILAMMLTGKILVAILGMAVFVLYGPGVSILEKSLCDIFLLSYSTEYMSRDAYAHMSPLGVLIKMFGKYTDQQRVGEWLLAILLTGILTAVISILLYKKRGSEMAGQAMAFPLLARIIKFLLLIPLSLVTGLLFYSMMEYDKLWLFVGTGFGFLLFSGVIEFIYCMDIREIFRDKKQMLISAAVTVAILAGFRFDVIGFDRNLPKQSQVQSMEIGMTELLGNVMNPYVTHVYEKIYVTDDPSYQEDYVWVESVNNPSVQVPEEDISRMYELLECRLTREELLADSDFQARENCTPVNCVFHMKNGSEKARTYWIDLEVETEYLKSYFEDPEIRKILIPILSLSEENLVKMEIYLQENSFTLEGAEAREVFKIFREEWENISFDEITGSNASSIELDILYTGEDGRVYGKQFWPNDAFSKTKECIEKLMEEKN
ncbi:MAG: DUF6449 domain-containing protein [Muricoprocola sp.]